MSDFKANKTVKGGHIQCDQMLDYKSCPNVFKRCPNNVHSSVYIN